MRKEQTNLLNGVQKDILAKQDEIHKQDVQIQKLEADKLHKLKQAGTEFEKELNLREAEVGKKEKLAEKLQARVDEVEEKHKKALSDFAAKERDFIAKEKALKEEVAKKEKQSSKEMVGRVPAADHDLDKAPEDKRHVT